MLTVEGFYHAKDICLLIENSLKSKILALKWKESRMLAVQWPWYSSDKIKCVATYSIPTNPVLCVLWGHLPLCLQPAPVLSEMHGLGVDIWYFYWEEECSSLRRRALRGTLRELLHLFYHSFFQSVGGIGNLSEFCLSPEVDKNPQVLLHILFKSNPDHSPHTVFKLFYRHPIISENFI